MNFFRGIFGGVRPAWQAAWQGFSFLQSLWAAIGAYMVLNAFTGALAAAILPYEIVKGVPEPMPTITLEEIQAVFLPPLIIATLFFGYSIYLLGGIIASVGRLIRGEVVSAGVFFHQANQRFLLMVRWALWSAFLIFFLGFIVVLMMGIAWFASGRSEFVRLPTPLVFFFTVFLLGLCLLYSPVILLDRGGKLWDSFRESYRFLKRYFWETIWLLAWVGLIGALMWLIWLIPAVLIGSIRETLGISAYTKGFPVFFFGLVLWFPVALLLVYFPVVLHRFYSARQK